MALALAGSVAVLMAASASAPANAATPTASLATPAPPTFSDVPEEAPHAAAVYALAGRTVMLRNPDGSFDPDGTVTRAEFAYFMTRAMDLPSAPGQHFSDVTPYDWYSGAVSALSLAGIIQGTGASTFSPERTVKRQEAALFVMRAVDSLRKDDAGAAALDLTVEEAQIWLGGFRDRMLMEPAGAIAVAAAYRLGILQCPTNGWFFPEGNLTRAEMAVMLYRAFLQPSGARIAYPLTLPAVSQYDALSIGSEGTLVAFLEARLTALRYLCGPVDGVYDHRTRDAVMAFQKVEGLERTGRMTTPVWKRLGAAGTPVPTMSGAGDRCEVDLTRQVLFMISDDKVMQVVHVSTGRLGTRTGHFSIGAKYEGWVKCVTLDGKMYYPSYVVSKTAIHGYESVPPYPASHGCVRVPVWVARDLYNRLPTGMVVDIFRS